MLIPSNDQVVYEITIESDKVASYGKYGASKLDKRIIPVFYELVTREIHVTFL